MEIEAYRGWCRNCSWDVGPLGESETVAELVRFHVVLTGHRTEIQREGVRA